MTVAWITGDALTELRRLEADRFACCVTSPPYWGLRDYGVAGQLGLEETVDEYVENMVEVFREVRRVLRPDGVLWLNLGDSYAGSWGAQGRQGKTGALAGRTACAQRAIAAHVKREKGTGSLSRTGLKNKDLVGVPWRVAFALQTDGWYLRADVVWHKLNPMPESVNDRPTRAHEYVFLLSRSERYRYCAKAIAGLGSNRTSGNTRGFYRGESISRGAGDLNGGRKRYATVNARDVWSIAFQPFKGGAHFATFPSSLALRCVLSGCPVGGEVLDPFSGAGTVGLVAARLQRDATLIELNPAYVAMAQDRLRGDVRVAPERRPAHRRT